MSALLTRKQIKRFAKHAAEIGFHLVYMKGWKYEPREVATVVRYKYPVKTSDPKHNPMYYGNLRAYDPSDARSVDQRSYELIQELERNTRDWPKP